MRGRFADWHDRKSALLVLVLIFETGDDIWISERRGVAQCTSLRDVAQQSTHDFSRPCFWQIRREQNVVGTRERADFLRDEFAQLVAQRGTLFALVAQRDER